MRPTRWCMNSSVKVPSFSREVIKFVEQFRVRCVACGENGHKAGYDRFFSSVFDVSLY
jgi:hypothetical protein